MAYFHNVRRKLQCSFEWGQVLAGAGQILLFAAFIPLIRSCLGSAPYGSAASQRMTLQIAGWFVTAGWILQRRESHQWPFNLPLVRKAAAEIIEPAMKVAAPFVFALLAMLFFIFLALHS